MPNSNSKPKNLLDRLNEPKEVYQLAWTRKIINSIQSNAQNNTFKKKIAEYSLYSMIEINNSSSSGLNFNTKWDNVYLNLVYLEQKEVFFQMIDEILINKYDLKNNILTNTPLSDKQKEKINDFYFLLKINTNAPVKNFHMNTSALSTMAFDHWDWLEHPIMKIIFKNLPPNEIDSFVRSYMGVDKEKVLNFVFSYFNLDVESIKKLINVSLKEFDCTILNTLINHDIPLKDEIYKKHIVEFIAVEAFSHRDYPDVNWYSYTKDDYFKILKSIDPIFNIEPDEFFQSIKQFNKNTFKNLEGFYDYFKSIQYNKELQSNFSGQSNKNKIVKL